MRGRGVVAGGIPRATDSTIRGESHIGRISTEAALLTVIDAVRFAFRLPAFRSLPAAYFLMNPCRLSPFDISYRKGNRSHELPIRRSTDPRLLSIENLP